MTLPLYTIQDIENGMEARIYEHKLGYAVSLIDIDANETAGIRIYPTLKGARKYALTLGDYMRYSKDMIEGKEYIAANWNDTAANFYTKNADKVTVETMYRHSNDRPVQVYTLADYDKWQDKIRKVD